MQCPSCGHEASENEFGEPMRCPDCGAYYEKALALKRRKSEPAAVRPAPLTVGVLAHKADSALRFAADKVTPSANKFKTAKLYCPACGAINNGRRHVPGSILIELVLWICLLIPGLIYSIWRHTASTKACTVCMSPGLIPVSSPRARRELSQ